MLLIEYQLVLRRYLVPQRGAVLVMALLLIGSISLQLVAPQAVRRFIDSVQRGEPESALIVTALIFLAVAVTQQALRVGATYNTERVAWAATNALRADLTEHVLRLDITFHQTHSPGELIERIDGDVNALAGFFSDFVLQLVGSAILLIGIVAAVAWINLWFG